MLPDGRVRTVNYRVDQKGRFIGMDRQRSGQGGVCRERIVTYRAMLIKIVFFINSVIVTNHYNRRLVRRKQSLHNCSRDLQPDSLAKWQLI